MTSESIQQLDHRPRPAPEVRTDGQGFLVRVTHEAGAVPRAASRITSIGAGTPVQSSKAAAA